MPDNPPPLRIGIIGYGYWGPKLARNFHEMPSTELAVITDFREDRLQEAVKLYPYAQITQDWRAVLQDWVDAVVIATPVHAHFPLAQEALRAGKHVFVEKPITAQSEQARDLIGLAKKMDTTLMVGHTFVYNPAVEAVRNIVQSGELGQVYYMNATRVNLGLFQPDINVMWDLAPHDLSLLRYVLNDDPIAVSAYGSVFVNKSRNLHEVVYLNLIYRDGKFANLRLSWLDPVKQRRLTIVGSQKMLVYDDILEDKVILFDKGVEIPSYSITEEEFHASYRHGEEKVYPIDWREPLRLECEDFVKAIRTKTSPRSSGEDGLRVLKVLESAQRSLLNGGVELKVEY
ncbi:MAG: Gfo/Idh/MocA family oxidoreductase [Anaerolineales bacterium]